MAVSTTNAISGPYTTNGVTTVFPFTFTAPSAEEVDVVLVDSAGVETSLAGYSVTIGQEAGGSVSFSLPPTAGSQLYVLLDPSFRQEITFENGSAWRAEPVNEGYDRGTSRDQALRREIDRGIKTPIGEAGLKLPPATARADKALFFDVDGAASAVSVDDFAEPARLAAAAAEAFVGETYTTVMAGLAATNEGGAFAVTAAGITTVYKKIAGVAVYQRDALTPAALAAPTGAARVGFVLDSSEARELTLEQKARQSIVVSPEDFNGYHGDGFGDDHAAFQRAMDYLLARGGGVLRIPPRSHLLNQSAIYPGNSLTVRGDSHGASWIINGSTNMPAIQIGVTGSIGYRNEANGLVFGQKAGVTPVLGNCGLLAINQSNIAADRLQTFQFPSRLYDGVVFDKVSQSYLTNFGLQTALNRGLAMTNQCLDIYAMNGRSDGNGIGIEFRDVQGMYFSNVACYGNTEHGLSMVTDFPAMPSQANRYFQFHNVVGDTSGSHNWNIRQLSLSTLSSCWASTQLSQSVNIDSDGFFMAGENVEDITMIAPTAASNNRHGINLDNSRSVVIVAARMGSAAFPEDWGGIGANNGKGGVGSGLFIGSGANFTTVTSGHFQNNTDYGIVVAVGAQNTRIRGADVQFNGEAGVLNLANVTASQTTISGTAGHNPLGFYAAPSVPASGVAVPNLSGVDCMVYIAGGNVSSVSISGQEVLGSSNASVLLAAGDSIILTYSSAPTWTWRGN